MTQRTYPAGVPSWIDTEQPDVDAAAEFYGGLFGWTFEDATPPGVPGRYLIARLDGGDIGGLAGTSGAAASWNTYIAVDDADAAARRLESLGASVTSAPVDAGEGGRAAALADPDGAGFRLWQARRRPGTQVVNSPGAWNFSDLHTPDVGAATAFYREAFNWEVDDLGYGWLVRRPGYGDHLAATVDPDIRERQAAVFTPSGFEDAVAWIAAATPRERPHWHVTFAVADRDQTAALAGRLGATILDQDDEQWSRTALIRDPQGAAFTASQFTPPSG
ncbi:VOC family protein [Arthrobacter jiangjiafuii]|uniref:VOC family protein n=1 Tax=Arthrobacter jiangjiafuii TaxID=2817475 RepID=A0A975M452_9MICC|nr:VOC family protein [Arthrobacter jiangjiafuii]MBP3042647.1 VOC family protein [Arthrobacter jiangjiafuii]QWC09628.1 VOC family protein [Arthrobacter jiangjiafuii]